MNNRFNFSYQDSIHKCLYGKAIHNGTIHVNWDCGSSLGLIPSEDEFKKI